MSALANELRMLEPVHYYNADASVLSADIEQPLKEEIRPQAFVKLPRDGQYQFSQAAPFRFEGILSHQGGYTQVAGHPSSKHNGFSTLATSVLEGLNVLDVVTADRVVAQISTVHPAYGTGQVPSVTFLGTRFENLRIGGQQVEVERDLDILGPRDVNDKSYFADSTVLKRISEQYSKVSKDGLPDWTREQYPKDRAFVQDIGSGRRQMQCSLVNSVAKSPGTSFGHVIDLPHFGRIFLGELRLLHEPSKYPKTENDKYRFQLTMIRLQMGCLASGNISVAPADSNGGGSQGGGHNN
jgi:hypothetical protein